MSLKKPAGNMYDFITHTWNPVRGLCPFQCSYCYVQRMFDRYKIGQGSLHLVEKELQVNLGKNNFVFVCSGCDLFHHDVPSVWLERISDHAKKYNNQYLWHTKNPANYGNKRWLERIGSNDVLCTTIESNHHYTEIMGSAPTPEKRADVLANLPIRYRRMITIEPITKFDLKIFSQMILRAQPEQVNIGADSGKNNLPEPTANEIKNLILVLEEYKIKIVLKNNLKRILKEVR